LTEMNQPRHKLRQVKLDNTPFSNNCLNEQRKNYLVPITEHSMKFSFIHSMNSTTVNQH